MANNCLKTQLKSVVDNNSLAKLGEVKILVGASSNNSYYVGVNNSESCTVRANASILRIENSGADWVDTIQIQAGSFTIIELKEQGYVFISNCYTLNELYVSRVVDIKSDIQYLVTARYIEFNTVENVDLGVCPLSATAIRCSHIIGNAHLKFKENETSLIQKIYLTAPMISNLTTELIKNHMPDLRQLVYYGDEYSVTGDISNLGYCVSLEKLNGPLCTGTIESFVASARLAGRETGSITTEWLGSPNGITFNGNTITRDGTVRTLSWTATTISYDGVTIDA